MSCFPKNKARQDDAIDLRCFNKICYQAAFAARTSKSMPSMKTVPKRDNDNNTGLPRFMQPSRAAKKRTEEKILERQQKQRVRSEQVLREQQDLLNANAKRKQTIHVKAQLQMEKQKEAAFQAKLNANIAVWEAGANSDLHNQKEKKDEEERLKKIVSLDTTVSAMPALPSSPIKTRRQMAAAAAAAADAPILPGANASNANASGIAEEKSSEEKRKQAPSVPQLATINELQQRKANNVRYGGSESFTFAVNSIEINKLAAKRCYRVLTYADTKNGRQVMDIAEGNLYWCRTGPSKRRITPDAVAYDSRELALSERFPSTQVGVSKAGNGTLPRVLVSFDCWGKSSRRKGGGGAAKYEYCKFIRIEQFLNSPSTHSNKQTDHPTGPNFYPKADHNMYKARKEISHSVYLDKRFDTTPWKKDKKAVPLSARSKALESSINVQRAGVTVQPRKRRE